MVGSLTETMVWVSSLTGLISTPVDFHFSGALSGAGAMTAGADAGATGWVCAMAGIVLSKSIHKATRARIKLAIAGSCSFKADPVQFSGAVSTKRQHQVVYPGRDAQQLRTGGIPFCPLGNLDARDRSAFELIETDFNRSASGRSGSNAHRFEIAIPEIDAVVPDPRILPAKG